MSLFELFSRQAPNKVFLSILLGIVSGIAYALLIPLVTSAIGGPPDMLEELHSSTRTLLGLEVRQFKFAQLFLFLCLFIMCTKGLSQVMLAHVSLDLTTSIRSSFYQRITDTSVDALEKVGMSRVNTAITTDIARIVDGVRVIPELLVASVTILGLLGFLAYLNASFLKFIIEAMVFGVVVYQSLMRISRRHFEHSRKKMDELQESIRGLIFGAKDLKLNARKSRVFHDDLLLVNEDAVRRSDKKAASVIRLATSFGDMISFLVIGSVTFVLANYVKATREQLVGTVMVLLYLAGPLGVVMNAISMITVSRVSLRKFNAVFDALPPEDINHAVTEPAPWNDISFNRVAYRHQAADASEGFQIGPVDFTIPKASITFIVGGNGSGKSTLAKLLTLHQLPDTGDIRFGGVRIDKSNIKSYRQAISAIYSDYFLFDRLLIEQHEERRQEIGRYLDELKLASKVSIMDGRFSTTKLSDGQKRRLALLVAFLDDKDIYLFDEWAADQDPAFKDVFYRSVLPDLKARGKTVIVISHDDRYFNVADQILVMESGTLTTCAVPAQRRA
ncbi:cyclic peptide export ABC transporter [Duganella sp. FT92W]|uniref:Cyclic peptide export ABC transporter n=1 Tax=Pseudoduganella rivuli TaxID=2666085 RepID=A0A7X2LS80_9BURK|nr:cyclic peptide export ABC transporter [Pseudoduganella rivuli]MRV72001.1 cyclic peptide export ABC transporter [Pseudoduganella rivuli]